MTTATQRIPILVTKDQKARIIKRAKAAGVPVGEFLRRAAEGYQPQEDDSLLKGLIGQVKKTTAVATKAIDQAMSFVAASQKRIEKMEALHKNRSRT